VVAFPSGLCNGGCDRRRLRDLGKVDGNRRDGDARGFTPDAAALADKDAAAGAWADFVSPFIHEG
jgi:hypothetical protein